MAVVVGLAAALAGRALAAAPRILIVSGKPLPHQVVVADWQTIYKIFGRAQAARSASRVALLNRPSLRVSMFWGPRWDDFLRDGGDARSVRPGQADQFGRFYPAHGGRPALLDVPWAGRWPREVSRGALRLLQALSIPVRL